MDLYNYTLSSTLDVRAPLKTKKISDHKKIPQFNNKVFDTIRQRRKAECMWLTDWNNWQKFRDFSQLRRAVSNIIHLAECEYFTNTLLEHKYQPKEIFRICDRLLGRNQDLPLPPGYTNEELATMFSNFLITKIAKIREVLESTCMDTIQTGYCCTHIPPKVASFKVLTCQDVEMIFSRANQVRQIQYQPAYSKKHYHHW